MANADNQAQGEASASPFFAMSDTVTALQDSFSAILKPLSWVYGAGMRMRSTLYKRGIIPSWEPEALTVSVGNIGWGGSGKTPVAGWLLDWAEKKNIGALPSDSRLQSQARFLSLSRQTRSPG